MEKIVCGSVVTPFQVIERGMVVIRGDRIVDVGEQTEQALQTFSRNGASIYAYDDPGLYIIPGFVDIHCHGGGGVWSFEDPHTFATFHLRHGTTSILPTLIYNQSHDEIMESLAAICSVMDKQRTSIIGIHLEGPYINPKYGAITAPIRAVNAAEYKEILALAGKRIKLWTLAPELEGQRKFMEEAAAYGITFSVGHSEAPPDVIFASVRLGLKVGCHLTNASGTTPNKPRFAGTREVGVHEAVMLHDEMYAEVIPDRKGIHVRPLMLRLIVKTKGADRVIIVTDAMNMTGSKAGSDVNLIPATEYTPNGVQRDILAGSLLTMDRAVHNMRIHTGIGWVDACKMASLNPAKVLKMDGLIGSLERGKRANLLVVTENVEVQQVMMEGEFIDF